MSAGPQRGSEDPARSSHYLCHLASGGISHMLRRLGSDVERCITGNRRLLPFSRRAEGIEVDFWTLFRPARGSIIADEAETLEAGRSWVPPDPRFPPSLDALKAEFIEDLAGNYYRLHGIPEFRGTPRYLELPPEEGERFELSVGAFQGARRMLSVLRETQLVPVLREHARAFRGNLPKRYIGVHYRNSDLRTEWDDFIPLVRDAAARSGITEIFVATDDRAAIDRFERALPACRIHDNPGTIDYREFSGKNLHTVSDLELRMKGRSKMDIHAAYFADVHALSRAAEFVPSPRSGMSDVVRLLRDHPSLLQWFFGAGTGAKRPSRAILEAENSARATRT